MTEQLDVLMINSSIMDGLLLFYLDIYLLIEIVKKIIHRKFLKDYNLQVTLTPLQAKLINP